MREIDPTRVRLYRTDFPPSREEITKLAISLYEIGQKAPITLSPQMHVLDGAKRVLAGRKIRRGFFTTHRGPIPRWYQNKNFVLIGTLASISD